MYKLYNYFRSSSAYRVRIALNLKGIPYEDIEVHLLKDGGQQHQPEYLAKNPQGLVPLLEDTEKDITVCQSLSILDYLEERHPTPALLPKDMKDRAFVRSCAYLIACDMQPINNLRVLQYLQQELDTDDSTKTQWYHHWLRLGFDALEKMVANHMQQPKVCFGDTVTLADLCLIPQVYNAIRFNFSMEPYPNLMSIYEHCMSIEAFKIASPDHAQPVAP